jgi:hypothetical protein
LEDAETDTGKNPVPSTGCKIGSYVQGDEILTPVLRRTSIKC